MCIRDSLILHADTRADRYSVRVTSLPDGRQPPSELDLRVKGCNLTPEAGDMTAVGSNVEAFMGDIEGILKDGIQAVDKAPASSALPRVNADAQDFTPGDASAARVQGLSNDDFRSLF
eukprot:644173-Prymnesium_polylepis.1